MTTENTITLLKRIDNGDSQAEDELFSRLMPELQKTAARILSQFPSLDEPVDALVGVFYEKSFKRLGALHFNSSGHLIAVACRRMGHFVLDELKRKKLLQAGTQLLAQGTYDTDGVSTRAIKSDLIEIIWDELENLPEDLHLAVVHRVIDEMTYAEIAKAYGKAISTTHDNYRKGIEKLRQLIDDESE